MKSKLLLVFSLVLFAFSAKAELSASDMKINSGGSSKYDAQTKKMQQQLRILNSSIKKIESEISKNKKESSKTRTNIANLEQNQKKIEKKLDEELANFNNAAISILRLQQVPSNVVVIQDTLAVQQKRTGALNALKQQLTADITNSRKTLKNLTENLEEQKQTRIELASIKKRLDTKRKEFYELRRQQQKVLKLPEEIRSKMRKDALYLAQNLNLNKFLSRVNKPSTVKIKTAMSKEKLPIKGKIVEEFGDSDRITQLPVQGMTVEGFARGKIKALHDGRVIYSGVFREYGHLIILEHQSGAHSLYAGFGKAIVDVGDYLNSGDLMGFLPSEEEPSLYYEVRINNKAQNPRKWLEKDLNA